MKVKEWCIALDNVSPYNDSVLGQRYIFLKGERATKEKVFGMIPEMTEEKYAELFRPATEEEINGEFEWDGEQYVLEKAKRMKSIDEFATDYVQDKYLPVQTSQAVEAGANYVLDNLSKTISVSDDGYLRDNLRKMIEQLKKK